MRLDVDIAPAAYEHTNDPCVLHVEDRGTTLVGVIDGRGDWGDGARGAARTRERLAAEWPPLPGSIEEIARHVERLGKQIGEASADEDFGCSFSGTFVLAHGDRFAVAAAGLFAVAALAPEELRIVFRIERLVDRLVAEGRLTERELAAFPHKNVCSGPLLGSDLKLPMVVSGPHVLGAAALVVAYHEVFDAGAAGWPGAPHAWSARAWQARDRVASPVIVLRRRA